MKTIQLGHINVSKIVEWNGPLDLSFLFPNLDPGVLAPHHSWLSPHYFDVESTQMLFSIHTFVVKTQHHTILVDTCLGKDKPCFYKPWNMLSTPYLQDLSALGIQPEDVDFVMCTHLHMDHVGWNTRLIDGRWVPTFPNAKYIFARKEWEHWSQKESEVQKISVLPIIESGQALLVETNHILDDEVRLEPTPGHTPGHVSVHLSSSGQEALITGDMIHHPLQCAIPDVTSMACDSQEQAIATRRDFLQKYAGSDVLILGTHFAGSSAGLIHPEGENWRFAAKP